MFKYLSLFENIYIGDLIICGVYVVCWSIVIYLFVGAIL